MVWCAGEGQEEDERLVTETIDEHCGNTDVVSIHMVFIGKSSVFHNSPNLADKSALSGYSALIINAGD